MPRLINKNGLSLMELMITAVILLIALGSLLFTFAKCLLLNEENNKLVIATNDAQMVLEQIRGEPFANINAFCQGYNPATFNNLIDENVNCAVSASGFTFRTVDVQITWTERQRQRDVTLSSTFSTGQ